MPVPNHGWIACKSYQVAHDTIWPALLKAIPREFIAEKRERELYVALKNGSTCRLKSYSAEDSFSGKDLHWIGYDEEPPREIWVESTMRLIDYGGVVLVAATPTEGFSFLHDTIEVPAAAGSPDHFCTSWSTYENPYVSRDEITRLSVGLREEELLVRIFGEAVALDGLSVFDRVMLARKLRGCPEPISDDGQGLLVWEKPVTGARYVFGADPAEGASGDNSSFDIVRLDTLTQVAHFANNKLDVTTFADLIEEQARRYGNAYGLIEANNHGHAVIARLRTRYPRLLHQRVFDAASKSFVDKLGWRTTPKTKPILVRDLRAILEPESPRDDQLVVQCRATLQELEYFVQKYAGRNQYGATSGRKDDRVISLALCVQGYWMLGGEMSAAVSRRAATGGVEVEEIQLDDDTAPTYADKRAKKVVVAPEEESFI